MTPWKAKTEEQGLSGGSGEANAVNPNDGDGKAEKARLQFNVPKHEGGGRYL